MNEKEIETKILDFLNTRQNILAIKYDNNAAFDPVRGVRLKLSKYRLKGCSDILCFFTIPHYELQGVIFMEVKKDTGKQSEEQIVFENKIKKMFGFYGVVRSVKDAETLLTKSVQEFMRRVEVEDGRCI